MDLTKFVKPASLSLIGIGSTTVFNSGISLLVEKIKPDLLRVPAEYFNMEKKEQMRVLVKTMGTSFAIAVASGILAAGVTALIENMVWPKEDEESQELESE